MCISQSSCIGLLLDRIPVSNVPRATVRTLKPKNLTKNLKNQPWFTVTEKFEA